MLIGNGPFDFVCVWGGGGGGGGWGWKIDFCAVISFLVNPWQKYTFLLSHTFAS